MKSTINWLFVFLLLFLSFQVTAEGYTEGVQYKRLPTPQPTASQDKIEVVELFWYGCPHCFDLEPHLGKWLEGKPDDVEFVRLPAIVGPRWELLAQAYFTAEVLGVMDRIHRPLFEALHLKQRKINDEAALRDFFVEQGVSEKDFKNTFHSFAVAVKMNNAKLMTRRYAITGVPALIINGKFRTSGSDAGGNENTIKVVDYLIKQERLLNSAPQAAAQP